MTKPLNPTEPHHARFGSAADWARGRLHAGNHAFMWSRPQDEKVAESNWGRLAAGLGREATHRLGDLAIRQVVPGEHAAAAQERPPGAEVGQNRGVVVPRVDVDEVQGPGLEEANRRKRGLLHDLHRGPKRRQEVNGSPQVHDLHVRGRVRGVVVVRPLLLPSIHRHVPHPLLQASGPAGPRSQRGHLEVLGQPVPAPLPPRLPPARPRGAAEAEGAEEGVAEAAALHSDLHERQLADLRHKAEVALEEPREEAGGDPAAALHEAGRAPRHHDRRICSIFQRSYVGGTPCSNQLWVKAVRPSVRATPLPRELAAVEPTYRPPTVRAAELCVSFATEGTSKDADGKACSLCPGNVRGDCDAARNDEEAQTEHRQRKPQLQSRTLQESVIGDSPAT
mmetsp:Transcript_98930/g.317215  ORF Transcript_98930/g.317215 Transcript_98930/m.317215 type:complete len:394 (-) Transcript_98930:26-1207(-)